MIWRRCILQKKTGQEEDALGNLTGGIWQTVCETVCRHTPWTDEQAALEDRNVTKNEQLYLIPMPYQRFPDCTHAVIDGIRQEIKDKMDLTPRYTQIQVRVYKE